MTTSKLILTIFSLLAFASCGKSVKSQDKNTSSINKLSRQDIEKDNKHVISELEITLKRVQALQKLEPFSLAAITEVFPKEIAGFKQIQKINSKRKSFQYKDASEQEIYVYILDFAGEDKAGLYMYSDFLKANRQTAIKNKDAVFRKTESGKEILFILNGNTTDFISLVNDRFELQMRADDIEEKKAMSFAENLLNHVKELK